MLIVNRPVVAFIGGMFVAASIAPLGARQDPRSRQAPSAPPAVTTPGPQTQGPPAQAAAPAPVDYDLYRIGPEDILDISVWKSPDLTRTVPVRPDGKISLPLLNDIQAAGLTPMQLRDVLSKGYSAYMPEPEVAVLIHEIHSIKVSVVGMVKTPGRYELKSQATVLEALALAGGLAEFAKRDRIVVFRRSGKNWLKLPFNYARVLDWNEEENFFLMPGDIIVVP